MNYLTQILQLSVFDADGAKVGKVLDVAATVGGRLPTVAAVFVKGKSREGWIELSHADLADDGFHLRAPWSSLPAHEPGPDDLLLRRDILDKQIVDVHDYRVVRVNDVRLAESGDRLCVVGVDAGPRALLRRAGVGRPVEALAKLIGRPLQSNLISWDDVETLEPAAAGGGRIKLKVPSEKIARLHPADIADIVEQLDPQQRTEVIESLDVETAADTIAEMEDEEAAKVLVSLEDEHAADILEEMDPDAAADLLADLNNDEAADILEEMEPEEAAEVQELMAYDEETAGGLMTTELVSMKATLTCEQAIQRLRELAPKAETIYYVYVVDDDDRLLGVISLRDLIVADPSTPIAEAMVRNVRHVHTSDHADEVGQILNRYNLLAIPVLDDDGRLVGMITVDDLMERLLPPEKRRRLPQLTVEPSDDEKQSVHSSD